MRKKILIFSIAYHPFIGGAEIAVKEITKRLVDYDFTILTLRMAKNLPKKEKNNNVTIYRIGFSGGSKLKFSLNWSLVISKYLFPFWAFWKALSLHRREKFDFSWSIMANYAGFAALFFKLTKPSIPFFLTLQEGDPPEYIKKRVGPFMPLYRMIFSRADKIQAISKFLANYARQMGHRGEITVVPNGVVVVLFTKDFSLKEQEIAKETISKKDGDIALITTSRLVKKNAVDNIIHSLAFLPDNFNLFIAGEGEEEDELHNLTKKLNLESRVKFGGFIPYEKLPSLLNVSDIFVRPSRSEGLGNSFLEAMAVGIPVIATPVGGIPDFLEDKKTGLMVEVDNPKDLSEKIKILVKDRDLYEKIIEKSKNMVLEKYSWNSVSESMDKIFKKLCES